MMVMAVLGGGLWWHLQPGMPAAPPEASIGIPADDSDDNLALPLPLPPVPPRIAEGAQYERCLGMLNTDPAGANTLAESWQASGGGEGAAHCLALAQIALGNPQTGAAQLDQLAAISQAPDLPRATVYSQAVQAWMMAGAADHALVSANHALELAPDDPDKLIDRAIATAALGHYMDAIDDLSRALDLDHSRTDALVLRGAAWRRLGHLDLAQDDIDRAVAADPDMSDALLERGILRQRQGNRAGAQHDWERVVQLEPDSPTADLAQQNLELLAAGPDRR
jgi:tetratricopeptide (TPR) repeat protein